ncbi:hypothetical protein [Spiroplasma citri]|uniref:Plectrovirus-related protein n=3 Tax=Spiroplasma TaxID=2132 RepID=A0AAJ4EJ04_SPICI|nr:hypothetical protein [Spiroplasma citri]APE74651.1 hypothetical protein SCITRI_00758 [Spiroplasma citri]QED24488.1 hypothetical protein FRX96_03350 [Spiroplasma citri]QIA66883.1 hypothetical protein GMI18_04005 [Spiroplasma citri]QIA68708.1 hypothetical protein GL298_03805 [Spiroplasma citri]QIA70569.1 hypothetical protein GL981_03815 [Spiroplasma citri]
MSKFISHCNYCAGYFDFSDYDIKNKPLETINKFKIRNHKYYFNSYQGIKNIKNKEELENENITRYV